MAMNGMAAEEEAFGDFLVIATLGYLAKYFDFSFAESATAGSGRPLFPIDFRCGNESLFDITGASGLKACFQFRKERDGELRLFDGG